MTWARPEDFSEKKFKAFLNKQPHEERRKKLRKEEGTKTKKVCVSIFGNSNALFLAHILFQCCCIFSGHQDQDASKEEEEHLRQRLIFQEVQVPEQ